MTNGDKINTGTPENLYILIAPLDWGLGHATRCIPIIRKFLGQGHRITLAADGPVAALLKREFPNVRLMTLPGYGLRYSRTAGGLRWKIFFQIPKILTSIKQEYQWLDIFLSREKVDLVISDSRFGLHSKKVFCVFITHQLEIQSPFGKWNSRILQKWNYRFINKFNECWIPDHAGENNLAGDMSHPNNLPAVPIKYIGCLSRMNACADASKEFSVLFILSGPEPQRNIFESIVMKQLASFKGRVAVVRGLPAETTKPSSSENIIVHNHLPSAELNELICASELVVGRSGYTTVMDLVKLKKKSVLVPTPGQTEQEYLGKYLSEKNIAVCMQQHEFDLYKAIEMARGHLYNYLDVDELNLPIPSL